MRLFRKRVTLEQQISALAEIGLELNAGVTVADLTAFQTVADLEAKPYLGLLEVLGIDIEREPFSPICDRLWMCDFERIEDDGDYRDVLLRLETLTVGRLALENVSDRVDIEEELAWVEFDYQGRRVHWDVRVEDDWLDPGLLVKYDQLLLESGSPSRIYANMTDYGQSTLLAAFTPAEKAKLDKLAKLGLRWIADPT